MTGRRYYLTTLPAWQRHAHRCAETHFIVLEAFERQESVGIEKSQDTAGARLALASPGWPEGRPNNPARSSAVILLLVAADEAAHVALENDDDFEPLPHPLARTPVSERATAALAPLGVIGGDDTFAVAEKLARVHPLLRHRVF